MIHGVVLTPLRVVPVHGGDVFHAMKATDPGYAGFGEAYLSSIHAGTIKPWKRHRLMTMNLIVVTGLIRFAVHDDRPKSPSCGTTEAYELGPEATYARLTVPPLLWMAFEGLEHTASLLLNIADLVHDPEEVDRRPLGEFPFSWRRL